MSPHAGHMYYLSDHLGSTSGGVYDSGAVQPAVKYTPFGQQLTYNWNPDRGYTGQLRDTLSTVGAYYYHARFYSTKFAHFMSADPVAPEASGRGLNRYSYTYQQPLNRIDRDGHESTCGLSDDCSGTEYWKEVANVLNFFANMERMGIDVLSTEATLYLLGVSYEDSGIILLSPSVSYPVAAGLAIAAGAYLLAVNADEIRSGATKLTSTLIINSNTQVLDTSTQKSQNFADYWKSRPDAYFHYTNPEAAQNIRSEGLLKAGRDDPGRSLVYMTKEVFHTQEEVRKQLNVEGDRSVGIGFTTTAPTAPRLVQGPSGPTGSLEYLGISPFPIVFVFWMVVE